MASAQSADSVLLLNQTPILQINADPQGNLLVARRVNSAANAPVAVYRYGQSVQAFTGPGQTLSAAGYPVVLASDSAGAIYLGSGSALVRPTDNPPGAWAPQLPSNFEIEGIGFDPQNNPILAVTILNPPNTDGRLLKLDRGTGQTLANIDLGTGVVPSAMMVDSSGAVYVTGLLYLTGFAAKLDPTLQRQLYFINLDAAMPHGIAVDSAGYAYVAETPLAVPETFGPPGGGVIQFGVNTVHKLDPQGAMVISNTGGGLAIAVDGGGNLIVTGGSYPGTGAFQTGCGPRTDLGGLSVTVLDPMSFEPQSSAFLAQQAFLGSSALLPDGSLYVATQASRVLHVNPAAPSSPIACIANGASFQVESSIVPGQLLTIFGHGLGSDPISVFDDSEQLPFSSGGTEVRIAGYPAPLLAVSSSQINAVVPYEISQLDQSQPAAVEISRNGSIIYTWPLNLAARKPSPLLHFGSSGALDIFQAPRYQDVLSTFPVPLADALNEDGTRNSAANPARLGSTVTIFATGFGQLGGSPAEDGMPGGSLPQWPADYVPNVPFRTLADIPVVTPTGNLTLSSMPITTIVGRTNAVLRVQATVPVYAYGFPAQLPFVIGPPANGTPVWTNFIYIAR